MSFILRTERDHDVEYVDDRINYEEWPSLREAEDRAKALRKQGVKVTIYQEV